MSISSILPSVYPASQAYGLVQSASSLSLEAGVVASLGAAAPSSLTYNALGLFDSFVQAGAAPAPLTPNGSPAQSQNVVDGSVVSALPSSPSPASGVYTSSPGVSSSWALALQSNPYLSSSLASDSINQGIAGNLSLTA